MRIFYFGKPYSFSHIAAIKRFGEGNNFVSMPSVKECIDNMLQNTDSLAVVPIENTYGGMITATVDELIARGGYDREFIIKAEMRMTIEPYLLGNKNIKLPKIKRIYSHEYALKSCEKWLKENVPKADLIRLNSTSEAAEKAKKEKDSCAIASSDAAKHYKLKEITKIKVSEMENMTAFFVLGKP
jgi:chorismate mutase/prephenate dehydratase